MQRPDFQTMPQGQLCGPCLGQGTLTDHESVGTQGIVERLEAGEKMFG
jgi:hypothetical protein